MNRIERTFGRGGQVGQYCYDRLRVRDQVVIVKMLAKRGVVHSDAARAEGDFASLCRGPCANPVAASL